MWNKRESPPRPDRRNSSRLSERKVGACRDVHTSTLITRALHFQQQASLPLSERATLGNGPRWGGLGRRAMKLAPCLAGRAKSSIAFSPGVPQDQGTYARCHRRCCYSSESTRARARGERRDRSWEAAQTAKRRGLHLLTSGDADSESNSGWVGKLCSTFSTP